MPSNELLSQVQVPVNDSLRVSYSVRLEDGSLLHLTGFTVTVVVKAVNSQSAPVVAQNVGVVQNPDTTALVSIPPNALTNMGQFYATIRALSGAESYSDTFIIVVVDHA